ncbi:hypothetical protein BCR44DRAFT_1433451, partial [Catenaria anguillulae PL171]
MLAQPLGTRMTHPNLHRQLKTKRLKHQDVAPVCCGFCMGGPVFEVDVVQDPARAGACEANSGADDAAHVLAKANGKAAPGDNGLGKAARVAVWLGSSVLGSSIRSRRARCQGQPYRYVLRERYALVVQEEDAEDDEDEGEGEEEGLVEEETWV